MKEDCTGVLLAGWLRAVAGGLASLPPAATAAMLCGLNMYDPAARADGCKAVNAVMSGVRVVKPGVTVLVPRAVYGPPMGLPCRRLAAAML